MFSLLFWAEKMGRLNGFLISARQTNWSNAAFVPQRSDPLFAVPHTEASGT
jgi:hypothetical protein